MVASKEGRSKLAAFDEEAMRRISTTARTLMLERYGPAFHEWASMHKQKVYALAHCTWLAIREELEREENG
jgi:hypothetical protein